jgi:type II secretory pathway component GspD/PulD (secretin)
LFLRITTTTQQAGLPVYTGADPARVPDTDEIRTQVVTLKYADPDKAKEMVATVLDKKAEVVANKAAGTIIITDAAGRIRTALSLIQVLEKQAADAKPPAGQ